LAITPDIPLILFSAETGQGRDELALWMQARLEEHKTQLAALAEENENETQD